ncbi:GNAT family N-acetyltransferase [Tateyamaria sp. SN6-1]|uniref:GNAT family N-acetyltransferase n=1 Tax=Tateyamaria sp. SN6-1 TaxID=3092148 RepID=UPI0039F5F2F5
MIHIRPAIALDAPSMARLLNPIIADGSTTAITTKVTGDTLAAWMAEKYDRAAWHVAVNEAEDVIGFQWIAQGGEYLPRNAAEIATFVQIGQTGLGIGSKLFDATRNAAKALGYSWINANIRADNEGGLIYYQSRGFVDYGRIENHEMENGQRVDKILKRFDL